MRLIDAGDLRKKVQRWCGRGIFSADGILSIGKQILYPTAWMPLPKSYKEGEEK